jgi:hypothetical protein
MVTPFIGAVIVRAAPKMMSFERTPGRVLLSFKAAFKDVGRKSLMHFFLAFSRNLS